MVMMVMVMVMITMVMGGGDGDDGDGDGGDDVLGDCPIHPRLSDGDEGWVMCMQCWY